MIGTFSSCLLYTCETAYYNSPRLAHLFSVHFLGPSPSFCPSPLFSGIEEGTCRFEVADSRTGSADVLALPIFSLFPVCFHTPFLPTLFHLRSSCTVRKPPFCCCFSQYFYKSFCWGLVVSNDLGGDMYDYWIKGRGDWFDRLVR